MISPVLMLFPFVSSLSQAGRKERSDALNTAIDRMTKKTRDLRRQVRFDTSLSPAVVFYIAQKESTRISMIRSRAAL